MKTFLHTTRSIRQFIMLAFFATSAVSVSAQTSQSVGEMTFENPALEPTSVATGTANGAEYRFANVTSQMDAIMTITGRSSSQVVINNLDLTGNGFNKAFQPQIRYNNGNINSAGSWWIEFQFQFVNKGTKLPAQMSEFHVTGLDIDGNGSRLREWDAFYGGASYTLENNSQLTVANMMGTLNLPTLNGKQFMGSLSDRNNIDTSATEVMTTVKYTNTNTMVIRLGVTTTGSTSNANRMYSVWFKNFAYIAPISTLPVKLTSFNAALAKDKVNLKWETASEINVSHFQLERSTDGVNFTQAAMVFSYGAADTKASYSYADNVASFQVPVVYYRLRSVDIDGKSELSETRIIRLSKDQANSISLLTYPNPVMNELRITVPNNWQNKQTVFELFNANGQIANRKATTGCNQTETINTSNLAPGFYIVRVTCDGQTAQQKIVKH
jgi:Secretion system C-terminal sorting domain